MNELARTDKTMSSREIAQLTGKQHFHVLRDVQYLEPAYVEAFGVASKFGLYSYRAPNGKLQPEYRLTKSQTLFIVSGYDAVLRARIQQRWEEVERELALRPAALALPNRRELALMILEAEKELETANETIAIQAPKVEFVEEVFEAGNLLSMAETAKMLGFGRNTLFATLRRKRILMQGIRQNEPYQTFIERGYFEVKGAKVGVRSSLKVVPQTFVTTRGLAWLRLNV